MFTGIVQGLGTIRSMRPSGRGMVFAIEPGFVLDDPAEGESISVNGVCLTATSIAGDRFTTDVSPETLSRSTLGGLKPGDKVNLERALRLSDRLGGHLVTGHVDGVGEVLEKRRLGRFHLFTVSIPGGLHRYIIEKGSIALDGISLTVNACDRETFQVAVIPHTARLTTMGLRQVGDKVNVEVDVIGKYIEKLLAPKEADEGKGGGLNPAFLARHGFL